MKPIYHLSSMEDDRFDSAFRCELESRVELPDGHHALIVSCDPPALGQDVGYPQESLDCSSGAVSRGRSVGLSDLPHFVQICLPDVLIPTTRMPTSIAWGELYATEADAKVQSMTERPHTPSH